MESHYFSCLFWCHWEKRGCVSWSAFALTVDKRRDENELLLFSKAAMFQPAEILSLAVCVLLQMIFFFFYSVCVCQADKNILSPEWGEDGCSANEADPSSLLLSQLLLFLLVCASWYMEDFPPPCIVLTVPSIHSEMPWPYVSVCENAWVGSMRWGSSTSPWPHCEKKQKKQGKKEKHWEEHCRSRQCDE